MDLSTYVDDLQRLAVVLAGFTYLNPTQAAQATERNGREHRDRPGPHTLMIGAEGPEADAATTALRDALYAWTGDGWSSHPLAMHLTNVDHAERAGAHGLYVNVRGIDGWPLTDTRLADLDKLPEHPLTRSALLVASAYTAQHESDRLRAMLPADKASDGRRIAADAARHDEHLADVGRRLPSAWDAWQPNVMDLLSPAVPAMPGGPTVPATMHVSLPRREPPPLPT